MSKETELAVISGNDMRCLENAEEVRDIMAELDDMNDLGRELMGRIKIGSGGSNAFTVMEPGAEDNDVSKTIDGVIVMSHDCNAYWARAMEDMGDDKNPDCMSADGVTGLERASGAVRGCATCPYNQFGSDPKGGNGKACKNTRRLYIVRPGDLFPMVLSLPSTSLAAFKKYRVAVALKRKKLSNTMTRISLKSAKNAGNIAYSTAAFEAVGELGMADAARMDEYAKVIGLSALKAGVVAEAYAGGGFQQVDDAVPFDEPMTAATAEGPPVSEAKVQQAHFAPVDADELPPEAR